MPNDLPIIGLVKYNLRYLILSSMVSGIKISLTIKFEKGGETKLVTARRLAAQKDWKSDLYVKFYIFSVFSWGSSPGTSYINFSIKSLNLKKIKLRN